MQWLVCITVCCVGERASTEMQHTVISLVGMVPQGNGWETELVVYYEMRDRD